MAFPGKRIAFIDLALQLDLLGFPRGISQEHALCVIAAESERYEQAVRTYPDGSSDRGIWQINSVAHPEVSDACAYSWTCACKEALRISKKGTDYTPWSAWVNGSWASHEEAAKVALDAASRLRKTPTVAQTSPILPFKEG